MDRDTGARTPEELENLLEDAVVLQDVEALLMLFSPHGLLAGPAGSARGAADLASCVQTMISQGWAYVAEPTHVLQAGRTALVVAPHALNVVRQGPDGLWRYEICFASPPG